MEVASKFPEYLVVIAACPSLRSQHVFQLHDIMIYFGVSASPETELETMFWQEQN